MKTDKKKKKEIIKTEDGTYTHRQTKTMLLCVELQDFP